MKHAVLLILLLVALYGFWQVARPKQRRKAFRLAARHGLWLFLIGVVVFGLIALANFLPATSIL